MEGPGPSCISVFPFVTTITMRPMEGNHEEIHLSGSAVMLRAFRLQDSES